MTSTAYKHFIAASAHLHRLVRAQLVGDDGQGHAPTQILGAARLAGLLMFRGFRVDSSGLAPGMRLMSDEARLAAGPAPGDARLGRRGSHQDDVVMLGLVGRLGRQ